MISTVAGSSVRSSWWPSLIHRKSSVGLESPRRRYSLLGSAIRLKKAKLWGRLRDDYKPLRTKVSDIGRALSRQELQRLASVAQSHVDWEAAFYGSVLAANTGLRGGEIKRLRIRALTYPAVA